MTVLKNIFKEVLNKIQNDGELRSKAIENIKNNIDGLLRIGCNYKTTEYDVNEDSNKIY